MWHHNNRYSRDILFAKQLLFSLEQANKVVFPDFNTNWHFDDKVGQKYLFESLDIPSVNSHVFYTKEEALGWIKKQDFPFVQKLRGGDASQNVWLIKSEREAVTFIKKAFKRGFSQKEPLSDLKERWRKFKLGKANYWELIKGLIRFVYPTKHAKTAGRERGYVYFQDFIPDNDSDIRVIVIDGKAFAIKRMVRKNDFRASGSGSILYKKELFDEKIIRLAFDVASKLQTQCIAFDFILDREIPKIVEISYGFVKEGYDACEGYWDKNMQWHQGKFDPCAWMVDVVVKQVEAKKQKNDF